MSIYWRESKEKASKSLFNWFNNNRMKSNADKCHILVSSYKKLKNQIGDREVDNTKRGKLLGVHLDTELSSDYWVDYQRFAKKQVGKFVHKVWAYLKTFMNAFFKAHFNYCLLIWMCHSGKNNSTINKLHQKCLRIIYNDK